MDDEEEYFTVVFKGDIRKLNGNPFKIQSVWGDVAALGVGNAYDENEKLINELEQYMDKDNG